MDRGQRQDSVRGASGRERHVTGSRDPARRDFFNPPEVRHARGRYSPEGFWLDTYDYDALIEDALEPLKAGREHYQSTSAASLSTAAEDALVLVEGTFLLRDRLLNYWNSSVYLSVPFAVAAARRVERGTVTDAVDDPRLGRYFGAQRLYFEHASPWRRLARRGQD